MSSAFWGTFASDFRVMEVKDAEWCSMWGVHVLPVDKDEVLSIFVVCPVAWCISDYNYLVITRDASENVVNLLYVQLYSFYTPGFTGWDSNNVYQWVDQIAFKISFLASKLLKSFWHTVGTCL